MRERIQFLNIMNENTINNDVTMAGKSERALLASRYRIVRQLGQGGMGSVWLAEDMQLDGKLFAIKMLPSILVSNKRAYSQLKSEALVAMKLVHPNIVQIRAFEENNGNPFLVMDYIDGETLDDWLGDRGQESGGRSQVSEEEVVRLLKPIAEALDYAHGDGVIHRDIKPANVIIRKDGRPFILDFGIAREIQETMTRVTGKMSSGTLMYMSPEQLNGDMPKKEQDIYSFAAMVYECLKGEPPFCRGAIEDQIKNKTPEVLGDDITVASSVMAGLAKKPEDRPKICADVLKVNTDTFQSFGKNREGERTREPQVGYGVHAAPQIEEISSRAPQSNEGPSEIGNRGGWKLLVAIAFLVIGFVYFGNQYRNNFFPPISDPPPIDTPNPLPPEKPISPTEVDVADIMVEAAVKKNQLQRIDDADGFERRKTILSDLLTKATSYGKAKQWDKAAFNFTNYVDGCNKLITLDSDRKIVKEIQSAALASQRQAEKVESSKYASARWCAALDIMRKANEYFSQMEFSEAKRFYESATKQFELCVGEAKTGRERREKEQARRAKWRKEGEPYTIEPEGLNLTMKWCPAGSFVMGSPVSEEGRRNDEIQHKVILSKGFWVGETEVTQGQWKRIMNNETVVDLARKGLYDDTLCCNKDGKTVTLREYWGMDKNDDPNNRCGDLKDNVPVYNLTWFEAVEFCKRLTAQEKAAGRIPDGYEFRLPTEAEWEYACRAGTDTIIPNRKTYEIMGVNNIPALDDIAWYGGNSSVGMGDGRGVDTANWKEKQYPGGRAFAREVKGKQPNNWGFYDMIGNVGEWCYDIYGRYSDNITDPVGASFVGASFRIGRVLRGGSWLVAARFCRSARRAAEKPHYRRYDVGFRVALAPSHPGMTYPEAPAIIVPKEDEKDNNFRLAKEAFDAKRYDEAYRLFMKSDLEDREVQYFMGHLYGSGHGVLRNEFEAVKWFRKAAEQGHLSAQVFLGMRYANGQGVVKDEYEAIKWFRKAADLGDVFSFYKLGDMYENGRGVLRDIEEAKKWYRKAAEKGDQNAKKALERLENVRVVKPVKYVQPVASQPQQPVLIDRPLNLKYCDNCGNALWHRKKISTRCEKCGAILFTPEAPQKDTTGKDVEALGNLLRGIGGGL